MNKKFVLLSACLLMAGSAMAQKRVTGHVVDAEGLPVVGAHVRVPGTKLVTVTDDNGKFSFNSLPNSAKNLSISYIGMETQTVSVAGNVNVVMKLDDSLLEEAVVVGYGTVKKGDFTGSVGVVKSEDLEKLQVSDVSKALEGQLPGVQITQGSGQPGSGATIYVRGIGSIASNATPLIIVDGVPYAGSLNSINTQDIATMNVLKDASATSIYGARGSNGIIMITTKKGREGKTNISFDAKWGWNTRGISAYETVRDAGDYYELAWEALYNRQLNKGMNDLDARLFASQNLVKELGGYNSFGVADYGLVNYQTGLLDAATRNKLLYQDNWLKEPFQTGNRHEYNVAMNGGSEKTKYYLSFNYLTDESYIPNSNFERLTGRINLDHQAFDWLKLGVNASYSRTESNTTASAASASNMFSFSQGIAPIYPIYRRNPDGSYMLNESGDRMLDYGNTDGHNRLYSMGSNPYSTILYDIRESVTDAMSIRGYADIQLYRGLTFHADVSMDNFANYSLDFQTPIVGDAAAVGGRSTKSTDRYHVINSTQRLNYMNEFNKHGISLMIAHETKADNSNALQAERTKFYISDNPEFGNSIGIGAYPASYNDSYHLESFFGRAEYSYDHKYNASATYRRDGSSKFAPENRWGNFWSVGAAWNMHMEKFMRPIAHVFNNLKIKASYGTQGNDGIGGGSTPYLDQYAVSDNGGEIALVQTWRGNRDITWEQSKTFNVGFEAGLWNNRLTAEFNYFIKDTDDMITAKQLPPSMGSPAVMYTNEMAMRNTGVELTLGGMFINTENVRWSAQLNLTHYKNELTRLEKGRPEEGYANGNYWRKKGGSLYDYYMVKWAGVDPETGDGLYYKDITEDVLDDAGNVIDTKVIGQTTTNDANLATKYQLGKSALPDLYGGLSTTLEIYGFDLSVSTAFSIGGWGMDGTYGGLMGFSLGSGLSTDIYKRWQKPGDVTDVPRLEEGYRMTGGVTNDHFLTKTTHLSLKNVTLGYTFPQRWFGSVGKVLQGVRIYAVGDNLLLLSKRKGYDPRQNLAGSTDSSNYSAMRTVSVGINLKF